MTIAVFDFCDTLFNLQSANSFVSFCFKDKDFKKESRYLSRLIFGFITLKLVNDFFDKFFSKLNFSKKMHLYALKGISLERLLLLAKKYYDVILSNHFNKVIINILEGHIQKGHIVIVASGGYDLYLQYFKEQFCIDYLICTKLKFNGCISAGVIEGEDCLGIVKLQRVKDYIDENYTENVSTIVYTDSYSDFPILCWADEAVVIAISRTI